MLFHKVHEEHPRRATILLGSMLILNYTVTLCELCVTFVSFVFSTPFVLPKYRHSGVSSLS